MHPDGSLRVRRPSTSELALVKWYQRLKPTVTADYFR